MPLKIVRNDITKMKTEAIVNIANDHPIEGDVFITPGYGLQARYIIHAVCPQFLDGTREEETKLRSCYQKSLQLAKEKGIKSISFPLISTGGPGYPKEEGIRIAVDEINAFLLDNDMQIFLVVFDNRETWLGEKPYPDLEAYIAHNYVKAKRKEENGGRRTGRSVQKANLCGGVFGAVVPAADECKEAYCLDFDEEHESKLEERISHISDTFSEYLMYLIHDKQMENSEVYKRAIVDKKIFSKIKNNINYHPQKLTALCLCVGAKLNLDESKDLLARAGYALSPCDKTDIIFSYFIENEIYDMIELDIQLEEHGLACIIS